ncbi:enoyl-CoA hydratase [Modestobacter sp. DSM 44400]|uniref:enoyl-CoA hydratase/isomerase family protein n=1 Tax=Modestobacter sp. DSM 44400 TaxID=1550230 RepID=UPI0008977029|nr:enoyl-CoA hydratase/isomerase family protein [Modestobacter sp. DSM 44400]SDY08226.1 enoyl-CoA hydratase [Modestobacter sp. DSM 44400]
MSAPTEDSHVLVQVEGGIGHLTLNRPRAINALSHDMVRVVQAALDEWEHDDAVTAVLVDGAGERGLCAGGDIRAIYDDARAGGDASARYWADEYRMNAHVARYGKPVVALMDGIVMGGGVGLAGHASHRVVREDSVVGMPEVGIGFVPDVGGTWLLARAPGELGTHLALTTDRMDAGDAIHCGFADAFVPQARRDELVAAIRDVGPDQALRDLATAPPASGLAGHRSWIDECYAADHVETVLQRLDSRGEEAPSAAAGRLRAWSPTSLKVTLRALRAARGDASLGDTLVREYRISCRCLRGHDFPEGIRAQVVDKDRTPHWEPARLTEVSDDAVDTYFAPLGDEELTLTPTTRRNHP